MPRAKGPEKDQVKLWLRKSTIEWLGRKANDRPVPTYLAEQIERQADVAEKNERSKRGGR